LRGPSEEERIGRDEEPAGLQLLDGGKGGIDLGFGAGPLEQRALYPLRAPLPTWF
jgi:hypothetical protein